MRPSTLASVVVVAALLAGCGGGSSGGTSDRSGYGSGYGSADGSVDPTPETQDGTSSYEFEHDDIDAANAASEAVKDYCSGAASEAQYVGCISHVDESDIP